MWPRRFPRVAGGSSPARRAMRSAATVSMAGEMSAPAMSVSRLTSAWPCSSFVSASSMNKVNTHADLALFLEAFKCGRDRRIGDKRVAVSPFGDADHEGPLHRVGRCADSRRSRSLSAAVRRASVIRPDIASSGTVLSWRLARSHRSEVSSCICWSRAIASEAGRDPYTMMSASAMSSHRARLGSWSRAETPRRSSTSGTMASRRAKMLR